ncbi:MAG: undecaprenyl-diphosphate phosphatase [Alphaproteobacteria bacterium]
MPLLQIVVLSIVQGITEFLPVSSSGHLIATAKFFGRDQGLVIDVAVHVGTLGAVLSYFWRDLYAMGSGMVHLALGRVSDGARLALYVLAGTVPVFVFGFLFRDLVGTAFRSVELVAWTTIGFGIVLYLADRFGMTLNRIEHLRLSHVLFIGLAQVLALIPGTSRSGITMTAGRIMGYERRDAARFSMLLSIPAIAGAGALLGAEVYAAGDWELGRDALLAAALSFLAALGAIASLMRWLRSAGFTPFVIYRLGFGALLLVFARSLG